MTFVVLALVALAVFAVYKHFTLADAKADLAKAHAALVAVSAKVEASVKADVDAVIAELKKYL